METRILVLPSSHNHPCHGHKWLKHQGRALNSSKLEEDVLREEEGIEMSPTHIWCRLSACKSEPVMINLTIFCIFNHVSKTI